MFDFIMYGEWWSGIAIIVAISLVCWAYEKVKDIRWPWQKF
jgi:hypothetical protein